MKHTSASALASGGPAGSAALRHLTGVALQALDEGWLDREGPIPGGGPERSAARMLRAVEPLLPQHGVTAEDALRQVVTMLAAGAADPADPWCVGHLHCPPLAVAVAADLAASALNQSMDSWDQAPAASALEDEVTTMMARLVFPAAGTPDAVVTTGGTESNLIGLLLARERVGANVQPVCGDNAHHSVARASWILGLPQPVVVPESAGRMRPDVLADVLRGLAVPAVVVATAGTTDTGAIDPLPAVADVTAFRGAWLHVDAAYGGAALFSYRLRPLLAGVERADSVTLDLHKLGWQPIAAGLVAVADRSCLEALGTEAAGTAAAYLSADDDIVAALPDLISRSLRTSRRPDVVKMAVTFRALGRAGLAAMVEHCCDVATEVAASIAGRPELELWGRPTLSTVVFRPTRCDDERVAELRRRLLVEGRAVLGRAELPAPNGSVRRWLKLTLLHPHAVAADYDDLLDLVASAAHAEPAQHERGGIPR